ncbi:MAG: GHMP kinase [Crenarchaeota archaeon]|nr:GHMP kinase [Thermoproteota archaeon]MDW8033592.1 galactokinase family protein [Nitrososphaerota archaeon]
MNQIVKKLCERAKTENGNVICFSSAPARVDFLNTHQDYKMLPVVPAAIEKRTFIVCSKIREFDTVRIKSLNLEEEGVDSEDVFQSSKVELREDKWFGNYFRSMHMLISRKYGKIETGLAIYVDSEIPIASGLASSAALQVSLALMYMKLLNLNLSKMELAELAYEAEHDIMKIPCGKLDQYASSYGGIIKLEFKPAVSIEEFNGSDITFVIADSGIKHSTAEIHPVRQYELNTAIEILRENPLPEKLRKIFSGDYASVEWRLLREEDLRNYLGTLPQKLANRIVFTIRMQKSTEIALEILKYRRVRKEDLDKLCLRPAENWLEALGEIVNMQHIFLRDLYEVSHPKLEKMRDAGLEAGALGVKISGAGMGGSLLALVRRDENTSRIEKAFMDAGARSVFTTGVGKGASSALLN